MMISSYVTLLLVPVGFAASYLERLPLSLPESIIAAFAGYAILWIINTVFRYLKGHDGIGEGDFDLLCLIGSFTGILGCWTAMTVGSAIGVLYGLFSTIYCYFQKRNLNSLERKIPFGPFLSAGAIIYIFFQNYFWYFIQ